MSWSISESFTDRRRRLLNLSMLTAKPRFVRISKELWIEADRGLEGTVKVASEYLEVRAIRAS